MGGTGARARGVEARVGDMRKLPITDGWADVAFSANCIPVSSIETDQDVEMAIQEMIRVTKPTGLIVVCTNYLTSTKQLADEIPFYKTRNGLIEVLGKSGLTIENEQVLTIPEKPWDFNHQYLIIETRKPN